MSYCEDEECECECHESDSDEPTTPDDEEIGSIYDSIDQYFQPTALGALYNKKHHELLRAGLDGIENIVIGLDGDPGKLYPLHERVRRVIGVLRERAKS